MFDLKEFFFSREIFFYTGVKTKIITFIAYIFFFKYYKPVLKTKLKKWWHEKLLSFFLVSVFTVIYQMNTKCSIVIIVVISLAVVSKDIWAIRAIFFILYIVFLLSLLEAYPQQKQIIIIASIFFFKSVLELIFISLFWILSLLCINVSFVEKNWDSFLLKFFLLILQLSIIVGIPVYFIYIDYCIYLIGSTLFTGKEINFLQFIFFFFKKLKATVLIKKIILC